MKVGDRIADRWEIVAPAPGDAEVERWRAVALADASPVELLRLRPTSGAPASRGAAFADRHRRLSRAKDPALVRTLAVVEEAPGGPWVVREPLDDATFERLRGPLAPEVVAAIGARLLPAVIAAEGATGGGLSLPDVGLDALGRPVLAPRGRPHDRVSRDDVARVAPESFSGRAADAAGGLFGLGVVLYELATGASPFPSGRPPQGHPPTPSSVRRGLPPALDAALLRLLSTDPNARAGALPDLAAAAGRLPDLRAATPAAPPPTAHEVAVTRRPARSPRSARVDAGGASLIVPARALAELPPDRRAALAGVAEVPERLLEELIEAGLPLWLEAARNTRTAEERARELASLGIAALATSPGAGCAPWLLAAAGLGLVPVLAVVTFFFPLAAWGFLIAALLLVIAAGATAVKRRSDAAVDAARDRVAQAREATGSLGRVRGRIAALRRRIAAADLPGAASVDLRTGLREVEDHVEGLVAVGKIAGDALDRLDPVQVRARRDALQLRSDPESARERDRLSRALADLEEVERRERRTHDEIAAVEGTLDEIEAVLARATNDQAGAGAAERLLTHARLASDASDAASLPRERPSDAASRPRARPTEEDR